MQAKRLIYLSDKVPELPYFVVAVVLVAARPWLDFVHIFSMGFLFLMASLVAGAYLKLAFKTDRPTPYQSRYRTFKYGFPSLHSMISIGAIVFAYFVYPTLSVILAPVGVFYIYARISGGYHTMQDVVGGAVIGALLGWVIGSRISAVYLPETLETAFACLFFIIPITASIARIKELI